MSLVFRTIGGIRLVAFLIMIVGASSVRTNAIDKTKFLEMGDVLVDVEELDSNGLIGTAPILWTNGIIPYEFEPSVSLSNRGSVETLMADLERRCAIDFLPRNPSIHPNYVFIQQGPLVPGGTANAAQVGMGPGGRRFLGLTSWSNRAVVLHELMHILGFFHEQSRADRDRFVVVHTENIDPNVAALSNWDIIPAWSDVGEYDFDSIMHYGGCQGRISLCNCPFSCSVIEAIAPYDAYWPPERIGSLDKLSRGDTEGLRQLYGLADCNLNQIVDSTETDCNQNGFPDECDLYPSPGHADNAQDCNSNGVLDECDIRDGTSTDCSIPPGIPKNNIPDECDIVSGVLEDCNQNGIADICVGPPGSAQYYVNLSGLINLPITCENVQTVRHNTCWLSPGYSWVDQLRGSVTEALAHIRIEHDCNPNPVRIAYLNSFSTFSNLQYPMDCSCDSLAQGITIVGIPLRSDTYAVGAPNKLIIGIEREANPTMQNLQCMGLGELGPGFVSPPGTYARIDVTTIGEFDCDKNGVPDDCEADNDSNGVADPCEPPRLPAAPHDRQKNRYISFKPANGASEVAYRVRKIANAPNTGRCTVTGNSCTGSGQGDCASGQFCIQSYPNGNSGGDCWVQTPVQIQQLIPSQDNQYTALCGATPVFRVWIEPVVHVGDCRIIPATTFELFTNLSGGLEIPTPLVVKTAETPSLNAKLWADVVGINNGVEWTAPNSYANASDVLAILAVINNTAIRPAFAAANLRGISSADGCLNNVINTADIQAVQQALTGASYGPPVTSQPVDPAACPVCP